MRIASSTIYQQLARGLNDNLTEMTRISNRLATGKKIARPSDDVLGTLRSMDYKLSIDRIDQYQRNIILAGNYLDFSQGVINGVAETLGQIKSLVSFSGGTTGEEEDRRNYANQTADFRDFLLDLSNSTYLDRYIFSGFLSDRPAYQYDAVSHQYVYQGDGGQLSLPIDRQMSQAVNIVGSSTDSTVVTAFSYTLTAPETITLADGSLVTYTAVSDPVHNSTTIEAVITHPDHPGDPDYEDTFAFSNFMDLANQLSAAWQYQNVDGTSLSPEKSLRRIQALGPALDKAQNQVLTVMGELGLRSSALQDQKSRLQTDTVNLQNSLGQTEDTDVDDTIIELLRIATTLNALRSSASKILQQSLFDFLK
jgi:flagellar hook-associated protein 3